MLYKPHEDLLMLRKEDPSFFNDWAKALEETTLTQAKEAMANCSNSACCLLVLEISKGNKSQHKFKSPEKEGVPSYLYENPTSILGYLPEDIYVAIDSSSCSHRPTLLNDEEGLNFSEIAQLLRGNEVEA